jgi:hypothetical protein
MVHARNTPIANPTVMTAGWFKSLTLTAHGMRIAQETLTFAGNGLDGDTAGVGEGCLGVTGQSHGDKQSVEHAENDGDAFG